MGAIKEVQDFWQSLSKAMKAVVLMLLLTSFAVIITFFSIICWKALKGEHLKIFNIEINDRPLSKDTSKNNTSKTKTSIGRYSDTQKKDSSIKKLDSNAFKKPKASSIHRLFVIRTPVKKTDSPSRSKYDLSHAILSQSAVGDNAKVENYNGVKQRHIDNKMFTDLMNRVQTFWDEHPQADRGEITVTSSSDKESIILKEELISLLNKRNIKVKTNIIPMSPVRSVNDENFIVMVSTNNKDAMIIVMEQENIK